MLSTKRGASAQWGKHRKLIAAGSALILIVVITVLLISTVNKSTQNIKNNDLGKTYDGNKTYAQQVAELESKPPKTDAPAEEKTEYYKSLTYDNAAAGDYKRAVESFEKAEAVSGSDLRYADYYSAAWHHIQLKDKANAEKAIANAARLAAKQVDPENPGLQSSLNERIDSLRQEADKL